MKDIAILHEFSMNDEFLGRYQKLVKDIVIPYQEKALKDEIEGAEKSHCIENFRLAAEYLKNGKCEGEFYGMVFQDSDVAKWLEGAAYSLSEFPDADLEKRCDEIIDIIADAQHDDGYLNTYFTVKAPDKRFTNLMEAHELYCAGHMIEAAVAYAECTGKTKLLDVMCKMSDYIYDRFITNKAEGYSGHPEIELALMRLYRHTENENYLELAKHFVDVRGVDSNFFVKEREKSGWTVWGGSPHDTEYMQASVPVREQTKATGHSVRAVYLYTAMADLALKNNDTELKKACETLWNNITENRMYITGAIGSAYEGEAFTKDYHLPNDTAYAETCAAIGLIFMARKMLALDKKSNYADVMERALYNCVLAGMELDGTKFFYVNPLESLPGISAESRTHFHTLTTRPKWFTCACCPPNVARLLSSIPEYAWSIEDKTVFSHLYVGGTLDISDSVGGKITVKIGYPYDNKVVYTFSENMDFTLAIRIPDWSENTEITLNGFETTYDIKDGYAYINRVFTPNDTLEISFDMSIKRVYTNKLVSDNSGKVAFSMGPIVYCAEGYDNSNDVLGLYADKNAMPVASEFIADKLCGIKEIYVDGYRVKTSDSLYSYTRPEIENTKITLIPYYTWANRGANQMRVWIPEM